MSTKSSHTLNGLILNDSCTFTIDELSTACSVQTEYIIELVDEGIVEPTEQQCEQQYWAFTGKSLIRAQKARRIQQDLGINLAGAALVLDMMEEIEGLRQRLRRPG